MTNHSIPLAGRRAQLILTGLVLALPSVCVAQAQARAGTRDVYLYRGPDRDQKLLENARKEGVVSIYTVINLKDSIPITQAFERKYGVKVQLWRASSEKVLQRSLGEAQAGRFTADVYEANGPEVEILHREKLLEDFHSPWFKDIPPQAFPKHRQWVPDRFNFFVLGYNTNLVKPAEVPNSYEDLLHPRWTGKLGLAAFDSDWFSAMVKAMGEEKGMAFFRKLADMKPQLRSGHSLISEMIASGELPAAIVHNHNIARLIDKGAPVKWKPLEPTIGRPSGIGVAKNAPHPHAALLFTDFLLSPEGQQLIKERNRVPSSTAVGSPLNNFKYQMMDASTMVDEADKWDKLWSELFLKGQAIKKEGE
jgi:iron(III) transport system substrate-binding protein